MRSRCLVGRGIPLLSCRSGNGVCIFPDQTVSIYTPKSVDVRLSPDFDCERPQFETLSLSGVLGPKKKGFKFKVKRAPCLLSLSSPGSDPYFLAHSFPLVLVLLTFTDVKLIVAAAKHQHCHCHCHCSDCIIITFLETLEVVEHLATLFILYHHHLIRTYAEQVYIVT